MAGKFGNFQIGLDLPGEQLRLLSEEPNMWPGILSGLLGLAPGFGLRPPGKQREMDDEIAQYRRKKEIDKEFHVSDKEQPIWRDNADGSREMLSPESDQDPRLDLLDDPTEDDSIPGDEPALPRVGMTPNEQDIPIPQDYQDYANELRKRSMGQPSAAPTLSQDALARVTQQYTGGVNTLLGRQPAAPRAPAGVLPPPPVPAGGQMSPPSPFGGGAAPAPGAPSNPGMPVPPGPSTATMPPLDAQIQRLTRTYDAKIASIRRLAAEPMPPMMATSAQYNTALRDHRNKRIRLLGEARRLEIERDKATLAFALKQQEIAARSAGRGDGGSKFTTGGLLPLIQSSMRRFPDDPEIQGFKDVDWAGITDDTVMRSFADRAMGAWKRDVERKQEMAGRRAAVEDLYSEFGEDPNDKEIGGEDWFDPAKTEKAAFEGRLKTMRALKERPRTESKMWKAASDKFRAAAKAGFYDRWEEAATDLAPKQDKNGLITETPEEWERRTTSILNIKKYTKEDKQSEANRQEADNIRRQTLDLRNADTFRDNVITSTNRLREIIKEDEKRIADILDTAGKLSTEQRMERGDFTTSGRKVPGPDGKERDEVKMSEHGIAGQTLRDIQARLQTNVEAYNRYVERIKAQIESNWTSGAAARALEGLDLSPIASAGGVSSRTVKDVVAVPGKMKPRPK